MDSEDSERGVVMYCKQAGWICLFLWLLLGFNQAGAEQQATLDTINALIIKGETYRQTGHLSEAEAAFSRALSAAEQLSQPRAQALTTGLLGYIYLQQRRYPQAKPLLEQAVKIAAQHHWPGLAALHSNFLGNYHASQRQSEAARGYYANSLEWALQAQDPALAVQAKLNLARLANAENAADEAWKLLQEAHAALAMIDSDSDRATFSLQIGYQALTLKPTATFDQTTRIELAYRSLNTAFDLAAQHSDQRTQSLSQGYLGQLYESQSRFADALVFTDQAADIAQRIDAKELLVQWEWQRGRVLKALGQPKTALAAYRRAVDHIQAIRQDIPVDYHQGRSSFRETLEPVYLGLADLLLQQRGQIDASEMGGILRETRQTVELIKKTELEDYFHNRCAIQTLAEVNLEGIAPKTAIIYPIILPDRLEILVGIGTDIHHRTVPVAATSVRQSARSLAKQLRRRLPKYKKFANQLYNWLIAPVEDLLESHEIDTLVVVPDGELRLVPLAALYDGKDYLIERYAVVTSPGLTLFDPKPIPRTGIKTLLAGLSQPGPVVRSLPFPRLQRLVSSVVAQAGDRSVTENTRDISDLFVTRNQTDSQSAALTPEKIQELLNDPVILKKSQQALALPGVEREINKLSDLLPSTNLLNEAFVKQRLSQEILNSPYRIVHIASHGVFGHSSDQSFILTYDRILTMDQLENLLLSDKFSDSPIELLTLSACQTAEGDDRSPLGLSGVALKTKVRSVLGSLWPVSDKATVQLMLTFYQQLNLASLTKAQALQQAQKEVLNSRTWSHPYYWSPFILIGNWL